MSVLSLDPTDGQAEALRVTGEYCRRVVTLPSRSHAAGVVEKRLRQLGSVLSPWSYEWLAHRDPEFGAAFARLLEEEHFDVVQFEFAHMAAYGAKRTGAPGAGPAFVLDEHNIEYDVARQTARAGQSVPRRAYSAINWRKIRREERRTWARLDGCTLTSESDQAMLLADAPKTRTAVIPNGVDLDFFQPPADRTAREPGTVLFFGAIDYYPNTEGLLFFLREIWPLLRSRTPGLRLCIVGRRPPDVILAHRAPDVEITGAVDDVRPYIERAAVVVAPLRIGGGTRLKILEALAMGKAVVSTSLGAEGLAIVSGRELFIADDPAGFARDVTKLLGEPELADRMGEAGRRLVAARYGWGASIERLVEFYDAVIEARRTV